MPDRLRQIFERFLDFWNRYNRRQKAIVLSSLAVVILTMVILVAVLSRPNYQVLTNCANYSEMSQVTALLTDNGFAYVTDDTTMTVSVREQDLVDAKMLLATNEIKVDGYGLDDALNSSFSTTESDKLKMWQAYIESSLEKDLTEFDKIKGAQVMLNLQSSDNSLFANKSGSSVAVILSLNGEMSDEEAENIALYLKNAIDNLDSKDITILSTTGESLYSGDVNTAGSSASLNKQLKYTQQLQNVTANEIRNQVLSAGIYGDVKVNVNFDINWSNFEKVLHEYSVPEGNEQGFFEHSYLEKSSGGSTVGGTPGTESNDEDTDYNIQDGTNTNSSYLKEEYSYLVNELVTTETTTPGEVILDTSTVSAVFNKYVVYNEDDVEKLGYLDGITWEEFKAQNAETVQVDFDQEWIDIIARGTGIPAENVSIVAYEKHFFYDADTSSRPFSFYLQILLAVAILGLLAFVVLRSSRPVTVEETEPELSVEQMLATTKEAQQSVEDIDLQEKSEVRKAIEKFVDENPEAVALLLRNWLDDGWD
ncbi:MAG: flagellar M-ring protein FliF C-terminal domain-containing protein [Thermoflexaceae bacterium]|nr:flagellar M-ring protein FliF C-terminal domain-containing protein [Thermoflexaceae bacterium]